MATAKLKRFSPRVEKLPWEDQGKGSPAKRLADRVKARLAGGKPLKLATGNRLRRKKAADTLKLETLEDQFAALHSGKRSSKWWNIKKDGINNSGLALWLTCHYQFWLRYTCGYEFPIYNDSIEFGNIFHWLIEHWLKGELHHPEKQLRKEYHPKWVEGWDGLTSSNKQTQEQFYALAAAMFPYYAEKYASDLKKDNEGIEVQFFAEHKLEDGTKIPLYGTIDRVWRLTKPGSRPHIMDHKTSSFINEYEIEQSLPLNFQLMFYAHAWELLNPGEVVKTVCHDVIRRTASKPHKGESLAAYGRRIGREVKKSPDYYFVRVKAKVTPAKLLAFRRWIINPIMEAFAEWAAGGRSYPNVNNLIGRYGPCRLFGPISTGSFVGVPRKRPTTRGVER